MEQSPFGRSAPGLIIGSVLIILGAFLILMNLDIIESIPLWRYWPMALAIIGLYKLAQAGSSTERREGFWFLVIGLWLQTSFFGLFGLRFSESWPILVIAWGISLIWESLDRRTQTTTAQEAHHGN